MRYFLFGVLTSMVIFLSLQFYKVLNTLEGKSGFDFTNTLFVVALAAVMIILFHELLFPSK